MVNAVVPGEAAFDYARKLADWTPLVLGLLETFTRDDLRRRKALSGSICDPNCAYTLKAPYRRESHRLRFAFHF